MTVSNVNEFLEKYASGQRNFDNLKLQKADLSGINLSGISLYSSNLQEVILSGADLSQASFIRCNLMGASLDEAVMGKTIMHGVDLSGASFRKARMVDIEIRPDTSNSHCAKAADLRYIDASEADLSYAKLQGVLFYKATLQNVKLYKADLSVWRDWGKDYQTDLREADLTSADISYANLKGAILRKAVLDGADVSFTNLESADTYDASMSNLIFSSSSSSTLSTSEKPEASNQALDGDSLRIWENLRFRSECEVKIAQALDKVGVLFFPNCKGRLDTLEGRRNKEPDFLIFYEGKWGILEVDGEPWHPPSRTTQDHERDRLFKKYGIRVEHFDASRCTEQAELVVREFLDILRRI